MHKYRRAAAIIGKSAAAVVTVPLSLIVWFMVSYLRGRYPDHPGWAIWNRWWTGAGYFVVAVAVAVVAAVAIQALVAR